MKKRRPRPKGIPSPQLRKMSHRDLPASVGMLAEVRSEMISRFDAAQHDMLAMEKRIDARFNLVDARFESLEAKTDTIQASVHRFEALLEEQKNENRIVFDAIKNHIDRFDRIEGEFAGFRRTLDAIAKAQPNH